MIVTDSIAFFKIIDSMVKEKRINHMDAVLKYCEDHDLDPQSIKKLVNPNLAALIKQDAQQEGLMKAESSLPL
jgi:hypothetical protein